MNVEVPDTGQIEQELNAIYSPYGVTFSVDVDDSVYGEFGWDIEEDGKLNLNGSGFFSRETDEMRALRRIYQSQGKHYDRNKYYIFVLDDAKAGEEPDAGFAVQGDMPRSKQFGYIFRKNVSGDSGIARLLAHELGHGIFTLSHTFDVNYSGEEYKSKTSNLMDYAAGTDLAAFQWNVLANPAPLTWFDDDEDGMALIDGKIYVPRLVKWIKENRDKEHNTALDFNANDYVSTTSDYSYTNAIDVVTPNRTKQLINLRAIYFDVDVLTNKHSTFSVWFENSHGEKGIQFKVYSYDDYCRLLNDLGFPISDYLYRIKDDFTNRYRQAFVDAGDAPDKLDVVYENMPDFVCEAIDDNEGLYRHLESLKSSSIDNIGTNEQQAIANLLKCFDKDWLRNKILSEPVFFEELLSKFGNKGVWLCINVLVDACKPDWDNDEQKYNNAPLVLLEVLEDNGRLYNEYGVTAGPMAVGTFSPVWPQAGQYKFGISYSLSGDAGKVLTEADFIGRLAGVVTVGALDPVVVVVGSGEMCVIPAVCAKDLLFKKFEAGLSELRGLYVGLLMPQAIISAKSLNAAKYLRAKNTLNNGPELPENIVINFLHSKYTNRKLVKSERYFRYHGENNLKGKTYTWLTNKKYETEEEVRKALALHKDWAVEIQFVSEIEVPSGTWISEGVVAPQGAGYPGGGYQVAIESTKVMNSWVIRTEQAFK